MYCVEDEGAYCKLCVLFGKFSDRHINILGVLVEQSLINCKKATKKLTAHSSGAKYHMKALELTKNFQSIMNNKTFSIRHQIDSLALQCIQKTESYLDSSLIQLFYVASRGFH